MDQTISKTGTTLVHAERVAWLRLIRTEHVGPMTFRGLLQRFGSAEAALAELPASYYNDYIAGIDRVTTRDLADAARRYIDPSHTAIVIVGDRKVIEAPLRAAGIAPLVILPPNH